MGVIGLVDYDPVSAERLVERLPALVTFGSIIGTLIRPGLGARHLEAADRTALQAVIDASAFTPFFQPIVDLWDGSVVGHEALTRFRDGRPPNIVFDTAARAGLGIELETACLQASIEASHNLPPGGYLSLNASPELVLSGQLGPVLATVARPVVLEITEHVEIDDYAGLRRELKRLGSSVRLAVDDAGAGYASFRHILELAPDFVKIDLDLVRGVDAEPARQALIAGMGYFAVKRKLRLVAEGIETRKELDALQALAVPYGQGYLLGRPRDGTASGSWPTKVDLPAFPHK
jgi:EAL domain-containing protein (putative c-di-GMP-specific phosphodiesterase class I)